MAARFAHPRGVLADLLDMNPDTIPDRWLHDKEVFALLVEYYSPSLTILRELEDPDPCTIPHLPAGGTTLDRTSYAQRVRARIDKLETRRQARFKGPLALFWKLFDH